MDSLDQVQQLQLETDKKWENFQKKLADFPHSFQMENMEFVHTDTLMDVKNHLEAALQAGFKTQYEEAQALNLVAFALFQQGQRVEALKRADKALAVDGQYKNLVSLANKAVILWQAERFQEAEACVAKLQDLKENDADFAYLVVKAKAELAASYTRFGPRFIRKAVAIFDEVIPEGKEPEVWVWKYGRALTHRHSLNLQHTPVLGGEESKAKHLMVLALFQDVIENSGCVKLQAKSFVEIALLLDAPFDQETREALLKKSKMTPLEASEKALALDDNDASILSKAANLHRRARLFPRALELLLKANELQPSSRGFHYLGLVYKALASIAKSEETNKLLQTDESSEKRTDDKCLSPGQPQKIFRSVSEGQEDVKRTTRDPDADSQLSAENPGTKFLLPQHARGTDDDVTKRLAARIKSFPSGACSTEFSRSDEYVTETVEALEKAIEFSGRMNSRAMLDLAFMYKALREFDNALVLYEEICDKKFYSGPMDLVTAYEQRGLILQSKAEDEDDPNKRKELNEKAEMMLNRALSTASRLYSRTPQLRDRIGDTWHSFSTLLKSVDQSDRCPRDKLREKANLFRLIKKHKESLCLLQEIVQLEPEKENDPEHLKLVIENLVGDERYSEALTFIELLQCTRQGNQTMDLFQDSHFVQKVHMQAAREALLQGSSARHLFHSAFADTFRDAPAPGSSCSDISDTSDSEASTDVPEPWDVMVLHEEDMKQEAEKLIHVLHDVCGLNVTRMDQDVTLGRLRLNGVMRNIRLSRLVVVLTGKKKRTSRELNFYISQAAQKASTVTLKAGGSYVPKPLKTSHKSDSCPGELWDLATKDGRSYNETDVSAVCRVFAFLLGMDTDTRHGL